MDRTAGYAAADIPRAAAPGPAQDSPLGDFFCDLVRARAGTDIALQNTEGVRADIVKGTVTFGAVYNALPYNAELAVNGLTGAQVEAIIKESLYGGTPALQVSGMLISYTPGAGAPADLEIKIGGRALEPDGYYSAALNSYFLRNQRWAGLAHGRDLRRPAEQLRDIIFSGLKNYHGPLTPPAPGRITAHKQAER